MYCKKCGRKLKGTEKFCPGCGALLIQEEVFDVKSNTEKRRKTNKSIKIIATFLLISISVVAVYLGLWHKTRDTENVPIISNEEDQKIHSEDKKYSIESIDENQMTTISYLQKSCHIYNADGTLRNYWEKVYDHQGNIEKYLHFNANGTNDLSEVYEYDKQGKLIQTKVDNEGIVYFNKYEYNTNGLQVKWSRFDSEDNLEWCFESEYDNKGNMIKWKRVNSEGDIVAFGENEYDRSGNRIRQKSCDFEKNLKMTYEYEYDKNEKLIKEKGYDSGEKLDYYCEYEYDENGNLIKETCYNANDGIIEWSEYEYISFETREKLSDEDYNLLLEQAGALGFVANMMDAGANIQIHLPDFYLEIDHILPVHEAAVTDIDPRNYISKIDYPNSQVYEIPVDDFKWICENVFRIRYQKMEQSQEIENVRRFQYVEDNVLYFYEDYESDWGAIADKILEYRYLEDGNIYAHINLVDCCNQDYTFSLYIIGNVIEKSGKRYWTFDNLSLQPIEEITIIK